MFTKITHFAPAGTDVLDSDHLRTGVVEGSMENPNDESKAIYFVRFTGGCGVPVAVPEDELVMRKPFTVFGTLCDVTGEPHNGMTVLAGHIALEGICCRHDDDTSQFFVNVMAYDFEDAMDQAFEMATC
ncbi:hypothetical protein [Streptomyces sp. N35]|uniref:hypothetical protein n=1 Tax=Streptomyces sp. N35 TaxID=2795730 RepID=UPI0018F79C36|nr:hypothetical protein [Streptomyces sp. N35]